MASVFRKRERRGDVIVRHRRCLAEFHVESPHPPELLRTATENEGPSSGLGS